MTPTTGDERVRHCGQCNLKVHNLSAMSREEAESLLGQHFGPGAAKRGERVCGRWRRRADGTVIFGDCPVGWAKARERIRLSVAKIAAMAGVTALLTGLMALAQQRGWDPRGHESFAAVTRWLGMDAAVQTLGAPPSRVIEMGDMIEIEIESDPPPGPPDGG